MAERINTIIDALLAQEPLNGYFDAKIQARVMADDLHELPAIVAVLESDGPDEDVPVGDGELDRVAVLTIGVIKKVEIGENQNTAVTDMIGAVESVLVKPEELGGLVSRRTWGMWDTFGLVSKDEGTLVGAQTRLEIEYHDPAYAG